jgi:hypothetical protein
MDLINIAIARDASKRALVGARLDDPVVPDSPGLLTRARRALARTRGRLALHEAKSSCAPPTPSPQRRPLSPS